MGDLLMFYTMIELYVKFCYDERRYDEENYLIASVVYRHFFGRGVKRIHNQLP